MNRRQFFGSAAALIAATAKGLEPDPQLFPLPFGSDNLYPQQRMEEMLARLAAGSWVAIVETHTGEQHNVSSFEVYGLDCKLELKMETNQDGEVIDGRIQLPQTLQP